MKQFKQLGWVPQALLSLVLLSAMSQSNAMSVRDRYLQEHPAAKVENSPEKESIHHKKHHAVEKHVVRTSEKHIAKKHEHHHAVKEHAKVEHVKHHPTGQPVKKEKNATSHHHKEAISQKVKEDAPRVVTPKLAPSKFDSQQARDAEQALQHEPVKKEVQAKPEQTKAVHTKHHHVKAHVEAVKHHPAKHAVHHAVKPVHGHHHKHHRAE